MGQTNAGYRTRYLQHVDKAHAQEYKKKKKKIYGAVSSSKGDIRKK